MKKLFALLLLPALAFAGKISENYVGVQIGSTNFDFKYSETGDSVSTDANEFSWEFSANYNLYQPSAEKYGTDLSLSYFNGSGDDSAKDTNGNTWTTDIEISTFTLLLRPYYDLGGMKVFVDLGLLHKDIENDIKHTSIDNASGDSSEFLYGIGFELFSGKFTFTPSISFSKNPDLKLTNASFNGNDLISYHLPVAYSYSENIDITASYRICDNDAFVNSTTNTSKTEVNRSSWGIGIDYKF